MFTPNEIKPSLALELFGSAPCQSSKGTVQTNCQANLRINVRQVRPFVLSLHFRSPTAVEYSLTQDRTATGFNLVSHIGYARMPLRA